MRLKRKHKTDEADVYEHKNKFFFCVSPPLFQMAFLQNRSISLVDMYIDNSEPSENVGQIHFSLEYDFQNTTLILRILQVSKPPGISLGVGEGLRWRGERRRHAFPVPTISKERSGAGKSIPGLRGNFMRDTERPLVCTHSPPSWSVFINY